MPVVFAHYNSRFEFEMYNFRLCDNISVLLSNPLEDSYIRRLSELWCIDRKILTEFSFGIRELRAINTSDWKKLRRKFRCFKFLNDFVDEVYCNY